MKLVMPVCFLALLLSIAALYMGCGAGGYSTSAGDVADISGNWEVTSHSDTFSFEQNTFSGVLTSSGTNVTGVLHALDSQCIDPATDIAVTGTVAGRSVKLVSSPLDQQIVRFEGTTAFDNASITGTYSIVGGCADGDKGTASGLRIKPISGNWSGSVPIGNASSVSVTATFTQEAPDSHGMAPFTGKATFANSPCFTEGTIKGLLLGTFLTADLQTANGTITLSGRSNPSSTSITGDFTVTDGTCTGDSGNGTITKQQ